MYRIAKLSAGERQELFKNTAAKQGMNAAIIEKDFWVCLLLDYLFHECKWKEGFAFKGGTSLSRYDLARVETLKLIPATHSLERLRSDYAGMRDMIFGDYPSFDEIMEAIAALENEINLS